MTTKSRGVEYSTALSVTSSTLVNLAATVAASTFAISDRRSGIRLAHAGSSCCRAAQDRGGLPSNYVG
jgi:hypothetical protein